MSRTTLGPIIYAEDEPDDVFFLERALEKAGVNQKLVVLQDGEQVISYLAGTGPYADRSLYPFPSLLLLDLNLPLVSGMEILEWMGQQPGLENVPVLILTSSPQGEDRKRALGCGARDFYVKPVSPKGLSEIARDIKARWLA